VLPRAGLVQPKRRWLITLLAVCQVTFLASAKATFAPATKPDQVEVASPPFSESAPAVFDLAARESLRIGAAENSVTGFSFDIFVYEVATETLVGRSDNDSTEPYFRWTAPAAGKYSVVIHNISAVPGKAIVTFLPPGSKGVGAGEPRSGNLALISILYATERERKDKFHDTPSYGGEPAPDDKLRYGIAKVSIPRAHQMGELEGPCIIKLEFHEDPEKHITVRSVTESTDQFEKAISDGLHGSPQYQVLVYVHGFGTPFEDALRRAGQLKYDLGFKGDVIVYSWPSQGEQGLIAYNKDGRNAELSATHFSEFLQVLAKNKVTDVNVIAHSMGNRVVVRALADHPPPRDLHLRHVALMAPDIDAKVFRKLANSLKSSAEQVTLYASQKDGALLVSERLAGYTRAGEGGSNLIVMPDAMDTVDASTVDTSLLGLNHSYYADNAAILSDLFRLLQNDRPEKRFGLRAAENTAGKYWIFERRAR
jgi:esterase/lipase superfamily enzyme